MLRWKTSLFLLFFATYGSTNALADTVNIQISDWIDKYQPSLSVKNKSLIINHVRQISQQKHIPLELAVGVITTESKFNPAAISKHGAKGLTQVVPFYHKTKINGRNILDIGVNLEVGLSILKDCLVSKGNNYRQALNCYSGKKGYSAIKYQNIVLNFSNQFDSTFKRDTVAVFSVESLESIKN